MELGYEASIRVIATCAALMFSQHRKQAFLSQKTSRGALGVARRRKPSQERGMRRGALSIPARWVVPRRGMQALGPKVQQRALTGSQCEPLPNGPGWAGGFYY